MDTESRGWDEPPLALGPEGRAEGGPENVSAGAEGACAGRSLRVGLQISADYWWCTNVVLRGVEEVCPCVLGDSWACLCCGAGFWRSWVLGGLRRCLPAPIPPPCLWSEQPGVLGGDVCVSSAGG